MARHGGDQEIVNLLDAVRAVERHVADDFVDLRDATGADVVRRATSERDGDVETAQQHVIAEGVARFVFAVLVESTDGATDLGDGEPCRCADGFGAHRILISVEGPNSVYYTLFL